MFDLAGQLQSEVKFPGLGTVAGFQRQADGQGDVLQLRFVHHAHRRSIATTSPAAQSTAFRTPKVDFKPDDYTTEQVFYTSKDGTQDADVHQLQEGAQARRHGRRRYLYGYGGFNIPLTPAFSVANLVWMELGGVFAVPNLRGGGEYGEDWHKAGTKLTKQNVFDDFIAAAEWLIDNNYTSTQRSWRSAAAPTAACWSAPA